ncbi:MAG: class I SAM-dependent methyltransferase [Actinomycetota bacterium]|nr:class I SAM-dependent methyltransferase [Actinomycetota bacterium]
MPDSQAAGAAPIDLRQVLADIDREVEAKRASGDLPADIERQLDATFARFAPVDAVTGDFNTLMTKLEESTIIDTRAPTRSAVRGVAQVKTVVAKAIDWDLRHLASQVSGLAHATTRAIRLLGDRVDELERDAPAGAEDSVIDLGLDARAPFPPGDWTTVLGDALAGVTGRVCHAECGDGAIVAALRAQGFDVYGVDPDERLVSAASIDVGDVRTDTVHHHLRMLPPGSLHGLVLSGSVDRVGLGAILALVDLARAALAPGGCLVVLGHDPDAWAKPERAVLADLAAGRPLHPHTWQLILARRGLDSVQVRAGTDGYAVSARR